MEVRPSVCPLDCPDRCALDVTVDQGRVVKIDGSDRSEYTDGYICAKVRGFTKREYSPDRILHPMKRTGPKGSGKYERVSWDEALRLIADRFKTLKPEAILPFHYDGSNGLLTSGAMDERLWNRIGASNLARTFCAANTGAGWTSIFGDMHGSDPLELRRSDALVLWGVNPSVSGIHMIPWVREAKKNGAFLTVIDPRRTPLAREADVHLPVLPGTDVVVAMAMIRVAAEEKLVDRAFIERSTRGFDALVAGCPTVEEAAKLSGVPPDAIRDVPRALGRSKAPFFRVGWGLERNRNGTDAVRAVLSLRAAMGRFGAPGSGVLISTSSGYGLDRKPAQANHLRKGTARTINMSEIGRALDETRDPEIGALFVYNSNPVATAPNQARVVRAMSRESLFVVVHEQVWTDTCPLADVILPATTFLEHKELCRSYSGYALQWSDAAVDAPGEARPNHWVFSQLARAMGYQDAEFGVSEEDLIRPVVKNVDALKETKYEKVPGPVPFVTTFPSRGHVDFGRPPVYLPPVVDAPLPLILISPASDKAITSQLFEFAPEKSARVTVAPVEAQRRGLKDGDPVRVSNSFGEVLATLSVSDELCAGIASMPKGLWRKSTRNGWTANALAPDHVDAQGGGACYNDARVEISRLA
jgi:anaerobic selenocysteine-containing dehydrogenase